MTKAKEFRRAPRNLSQVESEVVSLYAMVTMLIDASKREESVLRVETRITTRNMHIETGAMILTISSPRESRTLEQGLWVCVCAIAKNCKREMKKKMSHTDSDRNSVNQCYGWLHFSFRLMGRA